MPWLWPFNWIQPALAMPEHQQDRRAQREDRGEQHHDGQQQGAVDHQQDQEHGAQGHEQQDAVNAGEGTHKVRGEPGRSGDEGLHSGRRGRPDLVAQFFDHRFHFRRGIDGHHELDCLGVLGGDGTDHRAPGLQGLQLALEGRGLAELGRGECGVTLNHDHCRDLLGVPELGLPVRGLGGLGSGGKERCLVIG